MNHQNDRCAVPRSRPWTGEWIIVIAAAVLLFAVLGQSGLRHSEVRWAEIAREMRLSGDFFHPTIGWIPYFDKPLLSYWLVVCASWLKGGVDEWAARAPEALAGIVAVSATMWIGRSLWSVWTGRIAGMLLLTASGFLLWGRNAQADMENLAAIVLAVAWYWARRDKPSFTTWLGFWLIAFIGAQTKGLPAVVVPVLLVLPDLLAQRRWRRALTPVHALAACLGLMTYLAPFLYASYSVPAGYGESGLRLVFRENVLRYVRPFDHKGPIYLYFQALPFLLLPWIAVLLASIPGWFRIRKHMDRATRWLVTGTILAFAFFTLSGSRRSYYILPLLPFSALMIAVIFVHLRVPELAPVRRWGLRAQGMLLGLLAALELAAVPAGRLASSWFGLTFPKEALRAGPAIAAAALLLGYAGYRLSPRSLDGPARSLAAMAGAALGLMGGFILIQHPVMGAHRSDRAFALELARETEGMAPGDIGVFKDKGSTLLFYLGADSPLTLLKTDEDLRRFLSTEHRHVVVTRRRFLAEERGAVNELLREPPDLVQRGRAPAMEADGAGWVAWLHPGQPRAAASRSLAALGTERAWPMEAGMDGLRTDGAPPFSTGSGSGLVDAGSGNR